MRRPVLVLTAMGFALLLACGVALAATPIECTVGTTCLGTNGDDEITGTSDRDVVKARAGHDTVYGLGGRDKIFGQDGIDTLLGDARNDTLDAGPGPDTGYDYSCGGAGNDTLVESAGPDMYAFPANWGQDTITGEPIETVNDLIRFDTSCHLYSVGTDSLTIDLALGTASDGTNTVSWVPGVIEDVYTYTGNDTITGDAGTNFVHSRAGNDVIDVSGDGGGDFVDCGEGADTVTLDTGDTAFDPPSGDPTCETIEEI